MGRRDNIYKARIKILINELGQEKLKSLVDQKFKKFANKELLLKDSEVNQIKNFFKLPIKGPITSKITSKKNKEYNFWLNQNVIKHKFTGYSIIMISLKPYNQPPGDATSEQMKELSKIAHKFSFGEIRVTHEQNLVLPHIKNSNLFDVWVQLKKIKLTTPNIGLITDTICCPGMDYCALATARSIPISQKISRSFKGQLVQQKIGNIKIKISGCINACGHHHVGNIGILGLDRNGEESYQISLGGSADEKTSIGQIVGPSFPEKKLIKAIKTIIKTFEVNKKTKNEDFLSVFNRIGIDAFKKDLYEKSNSK